MSATARPVRSRTITRQQAAECLRQARDAFRSHSETADQAIGWAFTVLRQSRSARRLKIDHQLELGNYESADALLARSLLCEPERPALRQRYALSLFLQSRFAQARCEIQRVLENRPCSLKALQLAARIETALGEHERAVEMLKRAAAKHASNQEVQLQMADALLRSGLADEAARVCDGLLDVPPVLLAQIRRAQGRLLDAACIADVDLASQRYCDETHRESMRCLALVGDIRTLAQRGLLLAQAQLPAAFDAAEALVQSGCFSAADEIATELCAAPALRHDGLRLKACIASCTTASDNAEMLAAKFAPPTRLNAKPQSGDCRDLERANARLWLKVMMGALIREQTDARRAGADPNVSTLPAVLERAVAVLQDASCCAMTPTRAKELNRHTAVCLYALGRLDEVPAALQRMDDAQSNANVQHELVRRNAA